MKAKRRDSGTVAMTCTLASTPEDVRRALADISGSLADGPCPPLPDEMWEVAIAEILNNIVEHAYQQRPDGMIQLDIAFDSQSVTAEIIDHGLPMPGGTPPEGAPADLDVPMEDLPEGGFGWFLIRSLCDELVYRKDNGANRLTVRIAR